MYMYNIYILYTLYFCMLVQMYVYIYIFFYVHSMYVCMYIYIPMYIDFTILVYSCRHVEINVRMQWYLCFLFILNTQSNFIHMIEGRLEVQLPTIWTDETAEVGRVREEKGRRKNIREEKESETKKM